MGEICRTGCWVDKATGQVVESEPVEGRQLVAPGGTITPDVRARIDRARALTPAAETATVDRSDEDEAAVEKVEAATAPKARETATASKRGR